MQTTTAANCLYDHGFSVICYLVKNKTKGVKKETAWLN